MATAISIWVVLTIAPEVVVAFAYTEVSTLALVMIMHRFVAFPHIFTVYVSIYAFSYASVLAVVPAKIMHLSLGSHIRIRVCMRTHAQKELRTISTCVSHMNEIMEQ